MTFLGADTAQLRDQGTLTANAAQRLEERLQELRGLVGTTIPAQWRGPDADAFALSFHDAATQAADAASSLHVRARDLEREADQQDAASEPGDGGPSLLDIAASVNTWVGRAISSLVAYKTKIQYGMFQPRDERGRWRSQRDMSRWERARAMGDADNWKARPYQAGNVARWARIGRVAGPLGSIVSGGLTAIDEWNADPSLSTGERVRNTTIQVAGTTGGGIAGGIAGAKGGAIVGGLIGGPVGAAIGGVAGGIIGGVVGSGLGGKIAGGIKGLFS